MARRDNRRGMRHQLAAEAARLLAREEARGPQDACRKAAARLGCRDRAQWPDNLEIEARLREYRDLFGGAATTCHLTHRRRLALEAMRHLESFTPRLVGPVLRGTAGPQDPVRLHLYVDTPESVLLHLLERQIPFRERSVRLRYRDHGSRQHPLFEFTAGEIGLELVVLPATALSDPPLDPWTQRPDAGAGPHRVGALLDQTADQRWSSGT